MLKGPGLVLTSPALLFPLSITSPNLGFSLVSPSLRDEPTGDTSSQGAHYAKTSYH